jgi:hypothetical protein
MNTKGGQCERGINKSREEKGNYTERTKLCCIYKFKDSIMKLTKHHIKSGGEGRGEWQYNGGGELVSTLHTCMELSQ